MKKQKRSLFLSAALVLTLAACPVTALAAASDGGAEATETPPVMETVPPAPSTVYPAEVRASEENGVYYLEKVYYLSREDDPAAIPTEEFEREGRTYTLLDILKNDQTETDTKEHIEVITRDMDTNDMAKIIQLLEPELEITTEDGYTGILVPDYTSIQVEAAGYKTSSRTVSATRTYPNLSNADVSLIPKTVEDGGRTLTLADVQWQDAATDQMDGYDLAIRYNATATYTGTTTSKYATGYTVTADYKGAITRTDCDTVIYTAVFASHGETQNANSETQNTEIIEEAPKAESDTGMDWRLVLIPVGVVLLIGAGYGGLRLFRYLRDKKRGYVK